MSQLTYLVSSGSDPSNYHVVECPECTKEKVPVTGYKTAKIKTQSVAQRFGLSGASGADGVIYSLPPILSSAQVVTYRCSRGHEFEVVRRESNG